MKPPFGGRHRVTFRLKDSPEVLTSTMKLFALSLALCVPAAFAADSAADLQKKFVGAWKLISREGPNQQPANGKPFGVIMYDDTGHMAVQIANGDRPAFSNGPAKATQKEMANAYASYTAYYGTYTFEPQNNMVIHHLEGSNTPGMIGQDYFRYFEIKGNRLTLSVANDGKGGRMAFKDTTAHLTWEKLPATTVAPADLQEKFLGSWKLISIEGPNQQNGKPAGVITFDDTGHMTVQIGRGDRPAFPSGRAKATDEEMAQAFSTYTAYYGTYTFEPQNNIVIYHLEGSIGPGQIGQDNIRYFELKGNRLRLSVANDGKGGRIPFKDTTAHFTWEKLPK